jgi:hypothetical protein
MKSVIFHVITLCDSVEVHLHSGEKYHLIFSMEEYGMQETSNKKAVPMKYQ